MKLNIAEQAHIVNALPPIDVTGGKTADVFSMANYKHATIIVAIGVSAAAFTKILVNEVDNFAGDNPVAIPYALYAEETVAGDTLAAKEAVAAAGKTPSANDTIFYVIEVDADELSDGKGFIEVELTNGANSVIASVLVILSGARYGGDQSATAIA